MQNELILRHGATPVFSPRTDELEKWLTPKRLRVAWDLAKAANTDNARYPAVHMLAMIGVTDGTAYNWLHGRSTPQRIFVHRMDLVFTAALGEDWQAIVDRVLTLKQGGDNG